MVIYIENSLLSNLKIKLIQIYFKLYILCLECNEINCTLKIDVAWISTNSKFSL